MIDKQTIARILDTARIEEVIGEFVKLKKSGANFKGLSPFNNERTPSFFVSPGKGIFKDFSSGKGGNVVNFLMEHEHFTYPEALRFLAKKYGIPIQEESFTPEDTEAQNERESLFLVNTFAQKFFTDQLFETEKGKAVGLEYFKEREFKTDTIKKFQLGYSPEEWDSFTRHALGEGYKKEYLEKTGLTIVKEDRSYDRFRGRVIFPIHNITGRVLGFGGRTLLKDDKIPKYVNSPESEIYNKSQVLYGLFFAKNAIIRSDNCYLVEGYTDVISLHQAGIENVVASSGTSLTEDQIRLIKRYTPNITILYDGDPAGIKASFRGIDMVLEQGMNVRIVLFPDGEDPDSYARKHRRQDLEELITGGAGDFIRFKTGLLLKEAADDPIKRAGLIKEIVGSISLIPDPIYRTVYIRECSSLMEVQEQTLMNELNKILRQRSFKKAQEVAAGQEVEMSDYPAEKQVMDFNKIDTYSIERHLIELLLRYANNDIEIQVESGDEKSNTEKVSVIQYIIEELTSDDIKLEDTVFQMIFQEFKNQYERGENVDERNLLENKSDVLAKTVVELLFVIHELDDWKRHRIYVSTEEENLSEDVFKTVMSLKLKAIERIWKEIQNQLKTAENDEEMMQLQLEHIKYEKIHLQIKRLLGR